MRETTIARNYAETLLELARRAGDLHGFGQAADDLATAMQTDRTLRLFLESPRISEAEKNRVLTRAFESQLPVLFVRFLRALVTHRRQLLLPEIAREYQDLVDQVEGRLHASVTVAAEPDDSDRRTI